MEFKPLYFAEKLKIINGRGVLGVVTLWSKVDYVIDLFRRAGVDLNPASSPIAVFGNLYGNGLREMLRNLLYNPQIQGLLLCGHDRSGSREELEKYFSLGLDPESSTLVRYRSPDPNTTVVPARIRQTKRIIDNLVMPEHFRHPPQITWMGDPQETTTFGFIKNFFAAWSPPPAIEGPRQQVPLPEVEVNYFPSNPRAQVVVQDNILEAWKEVLQLLTRFGRRVALKKGERLELQHLKVVVEKPRFESEEKLRAVNLDPLQLWRYQQDILRGELRPDETYNYGHRLRTYFRIDTLTACAERLRQDPEDRKSYVTLWDNARDLGQREGRPCLVSLYFRKFEEKLTLSAAFRTHNALDAYPLNLYGLMAIQQWVAREAALRPGALVVLSHSLGLDPRELDRALLVIGERPFKVRLDPLGYFRITLDGRDILVEHRFEDVTLKEYRGRKAVRLQHEITRDLALSDINHAIYLGRQLARAEAALQAGREFVQE